MNEPMIDAIARHLVPREGDGTSRRGALRLLAGGGLAGLAGWLGTSDADAKKKCGRGKKKCGNRCIPKHGCCKNADCVLGQLCQNGRCGQISPGELTGNDFNWTPCGAALGSRPMETYTVNWRGGGFVASMFAETFRAWLWIYKAKDFDPRSPCSGQSWNNQASSPGGTVFIGWVDSDPLPAGKYVIVATGAFGTGDPVPSGSFRLRFGPQ